MTQTDLDLDAPDPAPAGAGIRAAPIRRPRRRQSARSAAAELSGRDAAALARQAEASADGLAAGRDPAAWWRAALLRSFVTPLPHDQAACLPLRLLPPPRVRPCNPVQALQWWVTRELGRPGGVQRLRMLSRRLASDALRLDFSLFVNALLPRLLDAWRPGLTELPRSALEAAWCDARVNRRWQRFALQLDTATADALLRACRTSGGAGRRRRRAASCTGENPAIVQETHRWPSTNSTTTCRSSLPAPGWPTAPP